MTSNFPNQPTSSQDVPGDSTDPVLGKTVAEVLGEIVWLMTQDTAGREMKVSEIEALVMPAILAKRFHVEYARVSNVQPPGTTSLQPIKVSIFASSKSDTLQEQKTPVLAVFSCLS